MNLVVKSAFGPYKIGQTITDETVINEILESANVHHVLKVADLPVAPTPVNPFLDFIKSTTSSGLSTGNSSVSTVSSGMSSVSSGLSGTNSSVSSVSSGLSSTNSSVSTVSTGNAS